jgi:EAL domain-containing protein (putative c-di-GMP-specific phosphodiesterase class I)
MAHQLNIKVLAEGVQSIEQRDILQTHRCDELQGYLFAKPLAADDFLRWHKKNLS